MTIGATTTAFRNASPSAMEFARFDPGIVLEGGSIDVNGAGLLLTTEECLLSESVQVRNPGLGRADLERYFADYLGIRQTIWLKQGIAGDDTHGHIDDVARFVDEKTIVTVVDPVTARKSEVAETHRTACGRSAPARARLLRWPTAAGQLREFLHCERPGAGSHLQRSQ